MRSTVFLVALLTLGVPAASAANPPTHQQTVVTTSGKGFPWGLLGVLGLMGLARRHPASQVIVTAAPVSVDAPLPSQFQPQEPAQLWETEEPVWEPAEPWSEVPLDARTDNWEEPEEWDESEWTAQQPEARSEHWDDLSPADSELTKPSERLAQRPPGGPDLSKPPGRR